jgi:hypothetical protein
LNHVEGGCTKQGTYVLQIRGESLGSFPILEENGLVEIQGFVKMPIENEVEDWKL